MEYKNQCLCIALLILSVACLSAESPQAPDPAKLQAFNVAQKELEEYLKEGQIDKALNKAEKALALSRELYGDSHKTTAGAAYNYGYLLYKVGNYKLATEMLTDAISMHETAYGAEAPELITVLAAYGELLSITDNSRFGTTEQQSIALHRALSIKKRHSPDDRVGYADLVTRVAPYLYKKQPDKDEALQMMQDALAIYEDELEENDPQLIPLLMALGDANAKFFDSRKQRPYYNRALKLTKINFPDDPMRYTDLTLEIGQHIMRLSQSPDSKNYIERAYWYYKKELGKDNVKTAIAALALGEYHFSMKDYKSVIKNLPPVIDVLSKDSTYRNYEQHAHGMLAICYENLGRSEMATEHLLAIGRVSPWIPDQDYRPVFRVIPNYPVEACSTKSEGWVTLDFTIDKTGSVRDATITGHEGHESFKESALDAVKKFRYAPRFVEGQPVDSPHIQTRLIFVFDDE
ncbi:MAG: TonB family protein [Gammaproteobacteria bacterium]|nr:MAG: TonB family protein [Gammaproteobacteria bacterium]